MYMDTEDLPRAALLLPMVVDEDDEVRSDGSFREDSSEDNRQMLGNILYVTFTTVVVRTLIVTLHKGDSLRVTRLLCFMNPLLGPFECVAQDSARYIYGTL